MALLQAVSALQQPIGISMTEIFVGLSFIIINLGSILAAWYNLKIKMREQDLRIGILESQFDKFQLDSDKIADSLQDAMEENKTLLQDLHVKFEKHLSYHEAKDC